MLKANDLSAELTPAASKAELCRPPLERSFTQKYRQLCQHPFEPPASIFQQLVTEIEDVDVRTDTEDIGSSAASLHRLQTQLSTLNMARITDGFVSEPPPLTFMTYACAG